jgi:hypothetical protein
MSHKSSSTGRRKKAPAYRKPHPDFPLTPHPSGRWCKRVRGKLMGLSLLRQANVGFFMTNLTEHRGRDPHHDENVWRTAAVATNLARKIGK